MILSPQRITNINFLAEILIFCLKVDASNMDMSMIHERKSFVLSPVQERTIILTDIKVIIFFILLQ